MIQTKLWKYDSKGGTNLLNNNSTSEYFTALPDGGVQSTEYPLYAGWSSEIAFLRVYLEEGTYSVGTYADEDSSGIGRIYFAPDIASFNAISGTLYNPSFYTIRYATSESSSRLANARHTFTVNKATWYTLKYWFNGTYNHLLSNYIMLNSGSENYLPFVAHSLEFKGEDLSQYILQSNQIVEDLSQELDTAELTLQGYPTQKEFDPETKLIMELDDGEYVKTYHWVVDTDNVSKPILSDDNYFNHTISLIEPSVISQKRIVDNISITYKLKDVNLSTTSAIDLSRKTYSSGYIPSPSTSGDLWTTDIALNDAQSKINIHKYIKWDLSSNSKPIIYLKNSDDTYTTGDSYYNDITNFTNANGKLKFLLPIPIIMYGKTSYNLNQFWNIGNASFSYTIQEYDANGNLYYTYQKNKISNSDFSSITNPYGQIFTPTSSTADQEFAKHWLAENVGTKSVGGTTYSSIKFKKYSDNSGVDLSQTTNRYTDEIVANAEHSYVITLSLLEFADSFPSISYNTTRAMVFERYVGSQPVMDCYAVREAKSRGYALFHTQTIEYIPAEDATFSQEFYVYSRSTVAKKLSHSLPYSALCMLQKAILNSGTYYKSGTTPCNAINEKGYNCPFYIDNAFVEELSLTQVNENFYNQKNLWEVLVEVGNYIHAIPEIKFGEDDKLMITFNKLGETTQHTDNATKTNIMNFKGVDDYICATTSYVSNMVQLGGKIKEIVAPKTTDEECLVYNDKCSLIVSKPIIEILEVKVVCRSNAYTSINIAENQVGDITEYVYEKNIYDLLSIDPLAVDQDKYAQTPSVIVPRNKGMALYYELGGSEIKGCEYQTPQANTNEYSDYAIKKIICTAYNTYPLASTPPTYGDWKTIKVNDFTFEITYRTRDDVRQDHARPDLRKYLLTSKYEKYPQHQQINNQEDILVDSFAFGSNMYGKLMRTSNTTYQVSEWVDKIQNLKQKGELYTINNELYYVYKVTNVYYSNHIESTIEFSKDYNQLSQVIGIPSEPRFYEISEQSMINRDKTLDDYLLLTDNSLQLDLTYNNGFLTDMTHIKNLILSSGTDFAKWAICTFKGDADISTYADTFGVNNFSKDILFPINAYSSGTTLTYEWDTVDNFSAGDSVGDEGSTTGHTISEDNVYRPLTAVQYNDQYGKATLLDFYILGDLPSGTLDASAIRNLPTSPIASSSISGKDVLASNVKSLSTNNGIILLKDSRERISVNYNLNLITNSDTFIASPFLYLPQKSSLKLVFLTKEVNKLSNGYINNGDIATINDGGTTHEAYKIDFSSNITLYNNTNAFGNSKPNAFALDLETLCSGISTDHFTQSTLDRVKAIAIICDVKVDSSIQEEIPLLNKSKFIIARNIPDTWTKTDACANWYFGTPNERLFTNKQ